MLFLMSVEGLLITLPSKRHYKLGIQAQPTGDCIHSLFGMELANCQSFQALQKLQTLLPPPLHTVAVGGGVVLIEGLGCSPCRRAMFTNLIAASEFGSWHSWMLWSMECVVPH